MLCVGVFVFLLLVLLITLNLIRELSREVVVLVELYIFSTVSLVSSLVVMIMVTISFCHVVCNAVPTTKLATATGRHGSTTLVFLHSSYVQSSIVLFGNELYIQ